MDATQSLLHRSDTILSYTAGTSESVIFRAGFAAGPIALIYDRIRFPAIAGPEHAQCLCSPSIPPYRPGFTAHFRR
ncbi:hypothetical protein, partial [Dyella silvatica]|uniref:hypothetical protein n=1 Tax=Dyella silvatica TaxID=2992128 RepID=UPI0022596547